MNYVSTADWTQLWVALLFHWNHILSYYIITVTLIAGIFGVIANALVLLVTWSQTFRNSREAAQLGMRTGLSETLLQDGSCL